MLVLLLRHGFSILCVYSCWIFKNYFNLRIDSFHIIKIIF